MSRRFTPPWSIAEVNGAAFVVLDAHGVKLAWVYYGDGGAEAVSSGRLTRDEARRIAANIVKLPGLLGKA